MTLHSSHGSPAENGKSPACPQVRIVGGGGTIIASALGRDRWQNYGGPQIALTEIVSRLSPELLELADVSVDEFSAIQSVGITTEYLYNLTRELDRHLSDPDVDAVVFTTGTNVMEEVAYWLDLTVRSEKPIVITGAMRQSNTFSFDGLANLFNSVTLAASGKTRWFGPVVLMNDEFFAAREVTKMDAVRPDAFAAARIGILGSVDERHVRVARAPARVMDKHTTAWATPFDLSKITLEDLPPVEIVGSYVDASGEIIRFLAESGASGIVTSGHGAGGLSAGQIEARKEAIERGVLFVSATRSMSGVVHKTGAGMIPAGDLSAEKARILLQLGLAFKGKEGQIREWFETLGQPDFASSGPS
jgi:L-asparaginase